MDQYIIGRSVLFKQADNREAYCFSNGLTMNETSELLSLLASLGLSPSEVDQGLRAIVKQAENNPY